MSRLPDPDPARVLIVDDEPMNLELLSQELEVLGYELKEACDGEAALSLCAGWQPDVVLLDVMMPGIDGLEVCRRLKKDPATRDLPVIFTTVLSGLEDKVAAFEAGGVDYVTKPFQTEELLARVRTQVELRRTALALAARNQRLQEEIERYQQAKQTIDGLRAEIAAETQFDEIIGKSPALLDVLAQVDQVAVTDATVLIEGETGTGKELFARAIHSRSGRSQAPLIKVNCAALPKDLIESELFGHEKGAFTGASSQRKGRFELADRGTIFLDEVGELSPEAQAKLLRVLQEHELERVGGSVSIPVDVRVIAATNRQLGDQINEGAFRADLFYRLNVVPLSVPPLRKRAGDVTLLALYFADATARRLGRPEMEFSPASLVAMESYAWPGNVRELQNVVERAVILSRDNVLDISGTIKTSTGDASHRLEDVEKTHIVNVLVETGWKIEGIGGAADRLGLNPSTLRGRMRKLGISKPRLG